MENNSQIVNNRKNSWWELLILLLQILGSASIAVFINLMFWNNLPESTGLTSVLFIYNIICLIFAFKLFRNSRKSLTGRRFRFMYLVLAFVIPVLLGLVLIKSTSLIN
jgi:hypothetical protein